LGEQSKMRSKRNPHSNDEMMMMIIIIVIDS
jgi:hypothetical protein